MYVPYALIDSYPCSQKKILTALLCRLGLRALLKPHTFEGPLPRRARPKPKDMPYYTSFSNRFGLQAAKCFHHARFY